MIETQNLKVKMKQDAQLKLISKIIKRRMFIAHILIQTEHKERLVINDANTFQIEINGEYDSNSKRWSYEFYYRLPHKRLGIACLVIDFCNVKRSDRIFLNPAKYKALFKYDLLKYEDRTTLFDKVYDCDCDNEYYLEECS